MKTIKLFPMDDAIEAGQIWWHIKSGNSYRVVLIAQRESDGEPRVCYQVVTKDGPVWVRPLYEWAGRFVRVPE